MELMNKLLIMSLVLLLVWAMLNIFIDLPKEVILGGSIVLAVICLVILILKSKYN